MARDKTSFLNASDTCYSKPLPGWDEHGDRHCSKEVGQSPQPQDKKHKIPGGFARDGHLVMEKVPKSRLYDKVEKDDGDIMPWRSKGGDE